MKMAQTATGPVVIEESASYVTWSQWVPEVPGSQFGRRGIEVRVARESGEIAWASFRGQAADVAVHLHLLGLAQAWIVSQTEEAVGE